MRPLTATALLNVWEQGLGLLPVQRALLLLASVLPETTPEALAALPIGQRDALLLDVRRAAFGSALASITACPACGERLEFGLSVDDLRTPPHLDPHPKPAPEPLSAPSLTYEADGYTVAFRLPDSSDLLAVQPLAAGERPSALLAQCVQSVVHEGTAAAPSELPPAVQSGVIARMAEADPQADIQLDLACPACAHSWSAPFDILSYLWSELEAWAPRLLADVHVLAGAYGWSEHDILSLSPFRRQQYLALVTG